MTREDTMRHIREKTPLNELRATFSSWCGRIEQACAQRKPIGPVEYRALEFDAVLDLLATAKDLGL